MDDAAPPCGPAPCDKRTSRAKTKQNAAKRLLRTHRFTTQLTDTYRPVRHSRRRWPRHASTASIDVNRRGSSTRSSTAPPAAGSAETITARPAYARPRHDRSQTRQRRRYRGPPLPTAAQLASARVNDAHTSINMHVQHVVHVQCTCLVISHVMRVSYVMKRISCNEMCARVIKTTYTCMRAEITQRSTSHAAPRVNDTRTGFN